MTTPDIQQLAQDARLLIIDDDEPHAEVLAEVLGREGYRCDIATTGQRGLRLLRQNEYACVVTDLLMKDVDGIRILEASRHERPDTEVIIVTAHATVERTVEAWEKGATSLIEKPVTPEELRQKVARAVERAYLVRENQRLREMADERYGFEGLIGESSAMKEVFAKIRAVAPTPATVLITGEPGTGKELIAKAIHHNSPRKGQRLVSLNCATLQGPLLRDELFGHIKGAFSGADRDREGKFEYADKGTLFLDEIGEMPLDTQAQLLRVLEERTVERIGGNKPIAVDVRLIFATNQDLSAAVQEGSFRKDLYSRINVIHIHLPPLAARPGDIPLLAQHFLRRYAEEYGRELAGFTADALSLLVQTRYPGNVRDLQNIVQRCVIYAQGPEVTRDIVAEQVGSGDGSADPLGIEPQVGPSWDGDAPGLEGLTGLTLKEATEYLIRQALSANDGNREQTANALGISERTLYRKLKQYGI